LVRKIGQFLQKKGLECNLRQREKDKTPSRKRERKARLQKFKKTTRQYRKLEEGTRDLDLWNCSGKTERAIAGKKAKNTWRETYRARRYLVR